MKNQRNNRKEKLKLDDRSQRVNGGDHGFEIIIGLSGNQQEEVKGLKGNDYGKYNAQVADSDPGRCCGTKVIFIIDYLISSEDSFH
jgi:hypothetical protein